MKRRLLLSGAMMLTILFASSCQKEEGYFSCDPEINEWAHQNLTEISEMSYLEMARFSSEEYQRTIYRALEPKSKLVFWEDRLTDILQMNWNSEEKAHLASLLDLIEENGPKWFEGRANAKSELEKETIINDFEIKTYRWKEYAIDKLGWNDDILYAILATPAKLIDTKGTLMTSDVNRSTTTIVKTSGEPGPDPGSPDCECSQRSDWCSGKTSCKSAKCHEIPVGFLPGGCGLLLYYKCDGMCKW